MSQQKSADWVRLAQSPSQTERIEAFFGGLSADPRLRCAAQPLLKAVTDTFEPLEEEDALYDLAQTLAVVGGQRSRRQAFDYQAAERAREYIHACFMQDMTLDTLSQVSGRDRWSLSRDFRTLYGTSPWRYVMMRRLDFCRQRMRAGERLVDIAADAGFADQSHMTRQFISRFGLSPGRWLRAIRG
ncbi:MULTISPECIES: AraC family transcriptional regulator [Klebsiella]|uniref:helix-turn-helix domain-containing protein n=1 Tax=Klebsiella TaxID=570 RepID=UPI002955D05C|nr:MULTISPECIES: AraC family transcriptional regulator [Klebsiella]HCI6141701.1 helix-turn-helix transcriptional regulator [Klebsiella variicola subsp. variicola]